MQIKLYNTLTGKKEMFASLHENEVRMYNCGPTVYNFPSIGNMRSYVLADLLRRTFEYFGYKVRQIINITDVGHLVSDGDFGEDKIEKSAKTLGKSAKEIARFYETAFFNDLKDLNIKTEGVSFPRATENIREQIELIKILEEKGFTYQIPDGIYFDTSKFKDYGKLGNINLANQENNGRIEANKDKRNRADFALWKFSPVEGKRQQEWDSPWGVGFPGWHIECSAMARKFLGQPFDIHTGGVDHISVHHNNEIAQSECAFDVPLANYWLHNEFIKIEGEKMSKSLGNIYTLADLKKRKFHPLSYRYWLLSAHYKTPANFTWESLTGSQNVLEKLASAYQDMPRTDATGAGLLEKFEEAITDDLNTPKALALLQEAKSKEAVAKMDSIFGLNIASLSKELVSHIPEEILELKTERDQARLQKNWQKSDDLRKEIESEGYVIEDQDGSSKIRKILSFLHY